MVSCLAVWEAACVCYTRMSAHDAHMVERRLLLPATMPVAGISIRQDVVGLAAVGEPVSIVREHDNPHDSNACAVLLADGTHVGYVPAAVAKRLVLHETDRWVGQVAEVLTSHKTWGLRITIEGSAAELTAGAGAAVAVGSLRDGRGGVPSSGNSGFRSGGSEQSSRTVGERRVGRGEASHRCGCGRDVKQPVEVVARSGRALGVLVEVRGDMVVAEQDGVTATYPMAAVQMCVSAGPVVCDSAR